MRIVACGILEEEIRYLAQKNHWDLNLRFLNSSLHVDFDRLSRSLEGTLAQSDEPTVVVYGTCHPLMSRMMSEHGSLRVPRQNCVEMLLGKDQFTFHLKNGAFFLLEDWVHRWDEIIGVAIGPEKDSVAEVFRSEHTYFLAVRTPVSGDFEEEALRIGSSTQLPVRWLDIGLEHLESCLRESMEQLT